MIPTVTKKTKQMIHYALGQNIVQLAEWNRERKTPCLEWEKQQTEISLLMKEVDQWRTTD